MKHLSEGGVTILKQQERKKQNPPRQDHRSYHFETKRILLTRDPRDRGSGIGMKIVGGKQLSKSGEMVAYVQAIYPGGAADRLHGELNEGDQVVEWNGVCLNGRTYEEVQQIISCLNGEIELLIRPGTNIRPSSKNHSSSKRRTDDTTYSSSYDNPNCGSDPDDIDRHFSEGLSSKTRLSASPRHSKDNSAAVSTHRMKPRSPDVEYSPSRSIASSSPQKIVHKSTPTESPAQQRKCSKSSPKPPLTDTHLGEIRILLKFDDAENTLIVQLIEAKNLTPKDINGLSDPFVKIYLLPGRCPENKRRTKHVSRTLNPQWNETFVFQNIYEEELIRKTIEFTLWDYDRFKTNDFLGAVVLDLANEAYWDDKPHWYTVSKSMSASSADITMSDISSQDELAQATSFDSIQSEKVATSRAEKPHSAGKLDEKSSYGKSAGCLSEERGGKYAELSPARFGGLSQHATDSRYGDSDYI